MEQDFATTAARIQQKFQIEPADLPAIRVSGFEVRFDGGAFTLHLYDVRESAEPHPPGPTEHWRSVEVGRFAVSPQALARLKQSVAAAEAMFSAVMGQPLMTDQEMTARFTEHMATAHQPPQSGRKK